jgi:hypothetical protein
MGRIWCSVLGFHSVFVQREIMLALADKHDAYDLVYSAGEEVLMVILQTYCYLPSLSRLHHNTEVSGRLPLHGIAEFAFAHSRSAS